MFGQQPTLNPDAKVFQLGKSWPEDEETWNNPQGHWYEGCDANQGHWYEGCDAKGDWYEGCDAKGHWYAPASHTYQEFSILQSYLNYTPENKVVVEENAVRISHRTEHKKTDAELYSELGYSAKKLKKMEAFLRKEVEFHEKSSGDLAHQGSCKGLGESTKFHGEYVDLKSGKQKCPRGPCCSSPPKCTVCLKKWKGNNAAKLPVCEEKIEKTVRWADICVSDDEDDFTLNDLMAGLPDGEWNLNGSIVV